MGRQGKRRAGTTTDLTNRADHDEGQTHNQDRLRQVERRTSSGRSGRKGGKGGDEEPGKGTGEISNKRRARPGSSSGGDGRNGGDVNATRSLVHVLGCCSVLLPLPLLRWCWCCRCLVQSPGPSNCCQFVWTQTRHSGHGFCSIRWLPAAAMPPCPSAAPPRPPTPAPPPLSKVKKIKNIGQDPWLFPPLPLPVPDALARGPRRSRPPGRPIFDPMRQVQPCR